LVRLQKSLIRRWEDLPRRRSPPASTFAASFETDEPGHRHGLWREGPIIIGPFTLNCPPTSTSGN
jgi:hypothetical protein